MLETQFSEDRTCRYTLARQASMFGDGVIVWLMLNPSTADEEHNDATIRRVIGFSATWGYADALVVNLSPFRATDPRDLRPVPGDVFERNIHEIVAAARWARTTVVAYGAHVGKVPRASRDHRGCARHRRSALVSWPDERGPSVSPVDAEARPGVGEVRVRMKEAFIDWKPGARKTAALLDEAQAVIEDWSARGYILSLRQLYYQLVARDIIPNNLRSYKRLGDLLNKARLGGLVDWGAIEDRGRSLDKPSDWDDPADIIETALRSYRLDRWRDQDYHVEVWCEKDALTSVLAPICERYHVGLLAARGYNSASAMYESAQRFGRARRRGQEPIVIYLGDHDPSGLDMVRDTESRLYILTHHDGVQVDHIALTYQQVEEYGPPPNPTKFSDARAERYVEQYGPESWELDALDPAVLDELVSAATLRYLDDDAHDTVLAQEEEDREDIRRLLDEYRRNKP